MTFLTYRIAERFTIDCGKLFRLSIGFALLHLMIGEEKKKQTSRH